MGYENLKQKLDGSSVFGEKIMFPSAPVPGLNNDQSLTTTKSTTVYNYLKMRFWSELFVVSVV